VEDRREEEQGLDQEERGAVRKYESRAALVEVWPETGVGEEGGEGEDEVDAEEDRDRDRASGSSGSVEQDVRGSAGKVGGMRRGLKLSKLREAIRDASLADT
jgi:hypothetical protein